MGRRPRVEEPDGFYHVGTRGNNKQPIYADDFDRRVFLALLGGCVKRFGWYCHTWCLMTNHYHLLVELRRPTLALGMCELNGQYAKFSNRRYKRIDHVFGKRYFAEHLTTDAHLLATCRYIVLNPVRAGLCDDPADWPWSSYRASAGLVRPPRFLALSRFLRLFDERPKEAMDAYRSFVAAGVADAVRQRAVPGTVTDA